MEVNLNGNISVCETIENGGIEFYPEFGVSGYESPVVEWSNYESEKPPEDYHWERSEQTPKIGDKRVVSVNHHFRETDKKDFWVFYQPALTSFNGIDCYLEEVEKYAFIQCRLLKTISINNRETWLQFLITNIVAIKDAYKIIPEKHDKFSFLKKVFSSRTYQYQCKIHGNWEYYFGYDSRCSGNAFLIHRIDKDTRLILFQEIELHREHTYLGNLLISEEIYQALSRESKLFG